MWSRAVVLAEIHRRDEAIAIANHDRVVARQLARDFDRLHRVLRDAIARR